MALLLAVYSFQQEQLLLGLLTKNINARIAQIKLIVNGETIKTKAEPLIYNGNVYVPVATIANSLRIYQEWDNSVPAVSFSNVGQSEHPPMGTPSISNSVELSDGIRLYTYGDDVMASNMIYTFSDIKKNVLVELPYITK